MTPARAATSPARKALPARALARFTVCHPGIRVHVRLLPGVTDVDAACLRHEGRQRRRRGSWTTRAYFAPAATSAYHRNNLVGTIVLPANGDLTELIPHEVTHAVMTRYWLLREDDEEDLATVVGRLCAKIAAGLRQRGFDLQPEVAS